MARELFVVPMDLESANDWVSFFHRHHPPVVGHKFSLGCMKNNDIVGVVIVGRPVSRIRDNGWTLEVTRLATDGTKNACSFLYGAAARAAFALGYRRIGMYLDRMDEITDELVKETQGTISRSGTPRMWAESSFQTAMEEFDKAVLAAFDAKMEWARPIEGSVE